MAFGAAVLLWTALIYRSQTIHRTFDVPVAFNLLPTSLSVTTCDPPAVLVTFAGQRKDFAFVKASDVKLAFGLLDVTPGRRTLPVTVRDLSFPEGLELEDIEPRQVRIVVQEKRVTNGVAAPK